MEVEEDGVLFSEEFLGLTGVVDDMDEEDDNNGGTTIPFS
jgi:hypothetical protein